MKRTTRTTRDRQPGDLLGADDYLREGGDLGLFFEGFPTDPAAQGMWTFVRRDALAAAMRRHGRAGEPLIQVRRVPIAGAAYHVHPSDDQHVDDGFARGADRLGALGFSLLRGNLLVQEHLELRLTLLRDAYEDLIAGVVGARAEGLDRADWVYRERARLIFWDALGLLHQVTEQLASLFEAWQRWRRQDGDLGELMVKSNSPAWRTIQSTSFGSADTWRALLGVPPDPKGNAALSEEQRSLLYSVQKETEVLVAENVTELRQLWTHDLHRAATRYKHSLPLLSVSHGLVWLGDDAATREDVRRLVRQGALVVADATRDGHLEQLVVPVTIGGIEVLFDAVIAATRLVQVMVSAILQRAENASGPTFVFHPTAPTTKSASPDDLLSVMAAYVGDPGVLEGMDELAAKSESYSSIEAAARRVRSPLSRGEPNESP